MYLTGWKIFQLNSNFNEISNLIGKKCRCKEMNIEILEFYPLEKNDEKQTLSGTIRIRLIDCEIEILGVYVSKCQDKWYFSLPSRKGTHHETGLPVRYPNFVFTDRDKHRQFIEAIREQGRAFIENRIADTENPFIFPQRPQKEIKQPEAPKAQNKPIAPKETASIEKQKPKPSLASKEWKDPPRLQARSASKFARR
jgi:hypothetical protein